MTTTLSQTFDFGKLKLLDAFERFTQASSRLEEKYLELQRETEDLKRELREKDETIRRSERLSMLGETAAGIAHEVRNPLGAIKLFLSMLKKDLHDRPACGRLVNEIERSVTNLDQVVSNILSFAGQKDLALAPLNLHSLIREQREHFVAGPAAQATIELNLSGNPFIFGNDHALRQVFYNLLLNALQATRYRGRVRIEVKDTTQAQVQISICDNGPGVAPELLGRVFDPFVTDKNEGNGLGLTVVRKIIEQHGGTVHVCNRGGAEFSILLPRRQSIES